jgi:hypothetical protein
MRSTPRAVTVCVLSVVVVTTAQTHSTAATPTQERPRVADTLPSVVAAGNANVEVTIVDGADAPLEGVTVKLTGVVNRDAVSSDVGFVTFYALPEGRYDVVASMKNMAPTAPRVLDLPALGVTFVEVTLKPYGPSGSVTDACGGFDPSSVRTLSTGAHLVLHVKVAEQHTVESAPPADTASGHVTTVNRVQVLQSFKRSAQAPMAGSIVTIRQGGGRIDRGDYIDSHSFKRLAPLNVGDEYVLFVYVDPAGTYTIYGAEEGAFRVRNGRVDALGSGGAASAWRGRSAERFFEALRILP